MDAALVQSSLEWDAVGRCAPGEIDSGDAHLVAPFSGGTLAAVVDGLGHGREAARAAKIAVDVLAKHAGAPVTRLIELCHGALRTTRGAAMTVVAVNHRECTFTAIGVGNVEAVLVRAATTAGPRHEPVLLRGGIVGERLPPLQASICAVEPGDVLVLASDGIRAGFWESVRAASAPSVLVRQILAQELKGEDDALVLAMRFPGRPVGG